MCIMARMKVESSRAGNSDIIRRLLKKKNLGVKIDLGCGANKVEDFIGIDNRPLPGVDIVMDLEKFPWDIPSECASLVVSSHVLEHISPWKVDVHLTQLLKLLVKKKILKQSDIAKYVGETDFESTFVRFMDEVWRILKPGGEFAIKVPYAGTMGFWQDPTHINPINEATFYYFDPYHQTNLFRVYRPMPWEIKHLFWDTEAILEVLLVKRKPDKSYMTHESLVKYRNTM